MKQAVVLAAAVMLVGPAAAWGAYELTKPSSNQPFDATLRQYGFHGIRPPSNLPSVGGLYYVDHAGGYTTICSAQKPDLEGQVMMSPTWDMEEELRKNGALSTHFTIDLRAMLKGDVNNDYTQTVHASFTDVVVEEIPLSVNRALMRKLIQDSDCNNQVTELVEAGKFVCQAQKTLRATAVFKLDRDAENKLATEAKLTPDEIKHVIKQAIEVRTNESVVAREGRVFATAEPLKFGIQVNPTCLSPKGSRFERSLPDTGFDRMVNFVKLRIIEPLLPAAPTEVAEHGEATVMVAGL